MKLKNAEEKKKKYTREEMMFWCRLNIEAFDSPSPHCWSKNGFYIDQRKQKIYSKNDDLIIRSNDNELLDIKFECERYGYIINCENLKKINIKNFSLLQCFYFNKTNSLDFSNIFLTPKTDAHFVECNNINPNEIKSIPVCFFDCSKNKKLSDFNNYYNSTIEDLIITIYFKCKNTTNIFTNNKFSSVYLMCTNGIYSQSRLQKLNSIFNIYYNKKLPKEHIMDFSLEMIDNEFEEEL